MKLLLSISLLLGLVNINEKLNLNDVNGSYCVMCMNDGSILESKNMEYTHSVASISKVMTAIIAIESSDLSQEIVVDDIVYKASGSSIYLKVNEVYTMEDLLYGLMLRSGNDAALMIAQSVAGSVDKFVVKMNRKANEIGMKSTIFHNPSGLDEDKGNISSSCDMALLTRYAMNNETFRKITASKSYTLKDGRIWINKNKFLNMYQYATGGKTGYTKLANRTLITTSKKGEMEVVVVSLNINDDFKQHITAHDWVYDIYDVIKVMKAGKYQYKNKSFYIDKDLWSVIERKSENKLKMNATFKNGYLYIDSQYEKFKNEYRYEVMYE